MGLDISKIKIIIWDLDDTFWRGTLSEGGITPIKSNVDFLRLSSLRGVVNSVCSKNSYDETIDKLKEIGANEYIVFPSIDWTPKGERIKRILESMGLRPANALFLDDNPVNLNEALHYCPELMIGTPDIIPQLIEAYSKLPESDTKLKRLAQYRVLERKNSAKSHFSSNEDFLMHCNLKVEIHDDCSSHIDRIAELVQRSNQLNYTKLRPSKEDLLNTINDPNVKCGYVTVKDKFGDYGLVGFFAIKSNECIHFLFSCRTIGQGVEQYVYASLGYPKLTVVGNVIAMVDNSPKPKWINKEAVQPSNTNNNSRCNNVRILFKGPCDLMEMTKYINGTCDITEEFTYVGSKGNTIESQNHSASLVALKAYNDNEKAVVLTDCFFLDKDFYSSKLYTDSFDVVFISSLSEPNLGQYRKMGTDLIVPFAEYSYPITNPKNWQGYISGDIENYRNTFSEDALCKFSSSYEFVGTSTPVIFVERLKFVLSNLVNPRSTVCVVLGSETPYLKNDREAYRDRHKVLKEYNDAIRAFAKKEPRIKLLDVNEFISSQDDFNGNINHFSVKIYYQMAQKAIEIINAVAPQSGIQASSKLRIIYDAYVLSPIKGCVKRVVNKDSQLFRFLQLIYRKLIHSNWKN